MGFSSFGSGYQLLFYDESPFIANFGEGIANGLA
jgi:hypothetical protein